MSVRHIRHTCLFCNMVFATHDGGMVLYTHSNGESVAICYHHLLEIENRHGKSYAVLPRTMPKRFDLVGWLNTVTKQISDKPISDPLVEKTLSIIADILEITKISKYVGGFAEINTGGLREAEPLILALA